MILVQVGKDPAVLKTGGRWFAFFSAFTDPKKILHQHGVGVLVFGWLYPNEHDRHPILASPRGFPVTTAVFDFTRVDGKACPYTPPGWTEWCRPARLSS